MVEIDTKIQINAPQENVWKIISKVDNDPAYWKGTTHIRNISKEQNVITRDVFLGKDNKCQQRVILFPKEGVHIKWLKGPIIGIKDILLFAHGNTSVLEAQMNYKIHGVIGLFSKTATKDLQIETDLALQLIKKESEGMQQNTILEERRSWVDLIHDKK